MSDAMVMDNAGRERILHVIEESLNVCNRFQFYRWAQGTLQGLLSHEMLLCVCGDLLSYRFKYSTFSCIDVDQNIIEKLTDPVDGALISIIETWLKSGRKPLCYAAGPGGAAEDPVTTKLRSLGFGHALAHGARDISSNEGSFFVLLQMPNAPETRHENLLDLLMPHLHMALYRILRWDGDAGTTEVVPESVFSAREAEVLNLIGQGKTNQEIGNLLAISPLTAKNHVHNILRKLRVTNRAQAVSKAHAARLIAAEPRRRARQCDTEQAGNEPAAS